MALLFVPDEEVGFLEPRIRSSNIEDLPYHFDVITRLFAGNACHAYQRLRGVN